MAEVERIAGQPVHARTGRGIQLTAAGEALARRARRIRIEVHEAERELAQIRAGGSGHVRIGAVTAPALDLVLPALRTARLTLPGVTAEVTVAPSGPLCTQLLAGELDLVLGRLPQGMERGLFDFLRIGEEPVALVVRRDHALIGQTAPRPRDLLAFDWVLPGGDSPLTQAVRDRLAALGLPDPPQRLSTASFLLTLALVIQTNAIAPMARAVADRFATAADAPYRTVPIDLGLTVPAYGLVTRAGARLTPAAQEMLRLILAAAEIPLQDR